MKQHRKTNAVKNNEVWLQVKAKMKEAHDSEVNSSKSIENQIKEVIKDKEAKTIVKSK